MSRASKAELERRIDEVYDLLLSRVTVRAIAGYCHTKWGVSARQVRTYMARARQRMAELAGETQPDKLARAIADYDMLFAKQLSAGRLAEARQTLDSIVRLSVWPPPSASSSTTSPPTQIDSWPRRWHVNCPSSSTKQNALRAELLSRTKGRAAGPESWVPHAPTPSSAGSSTAQPGRSSTAGRPAAARPMPC